MIIHSSECGFMSPPGSPAKSKRRPRGHVVRAPAAPGFAARLASPSRPEGQGSARPRVREVVREGARGAYRNAILEAAERVFARSGFYTTRMADIAREAGVGVGTLYN